MRNWLFSWKDELLAGSALVSGILSFCIAAYYSIRLFLPNGPVYTVIGYIAKHHVGL